MLRLLHLPCQVALGEYRDVEVETSSGEDTEGEYFRVRFTEPDNVGQVCGGAAALFSSLASYFCAAALLLRRLWGLVVYLYCVACRAYNQNITTVMCGC